MTVKETITKILKNENSNITLDDEDDYGAKFKEIGLDSLNLVMAMLMIGEHYALELDESDLEEIETVGELVSYIEQKTG